MHRKVSANSLIRIRRTFTELDSKPHHPDLDRAAITYCEAFITEASQYSITNHLAEQARQLLADFRGYDIDAHVDGELFDEETLMLIDMYA